MREYFVKSMAIGFQANQVCKEENQRRNLATNNFGWLCEIQEKSSCKTNLEHFLESIVYILYIVSNLRKSGSQESNASNSVQIGANVKKLWPFEGNYTMLKDNFAPLRNSCKPCETKSEENQFCNPVQNFCKHCEIFLCNFQILCTDSVR